MVATCVATVVDLAESGPVAFIVETGFGSAGASVAVENVGFTPGTVEVTMLTGGSVAVVVGAAVTGIGEDVGSVTEDAAETWADCVSWHLIGAELTACAEADVAAATGRGAVTCGSGAVGAWTEAVTGVDG